MLPNALLTLPTYLAGSSGGGFAGALTFLLLDGAASLNQPQQMIAQISTAVGKSFTAGHQQKLALLKSYAR